MFSPGDSRAANPESQWDSFQEEVFSWTFHHLEVVLIFLTPAMAVPNYKYTGS